MLTTCHCRLVGKLTIVAARLNKLFAIMINALRSTVGSWAIKILFVLLIASFAVWGIGDIFRDGGIDQRVGKVGDRPISLVEIDRVFQGQLDNLRRSFDPTIEPTTAIALGALDSAARQVVAGALIDEAAGTLNLRASDEEIALEIAQNPSLQGLDGQFDQRIFRNILASNGLTEQDFLEQTRRESARQQLLGATAGTISAPDTLVDVVFAHDNETRKASYVHLLNDDQTDVAEPTADALSAYFEENSENYRAPEYRRLSVLTLRPEDLLDEIGVDEAQLLARYDDRIDQYNSPETRDLLQAVVQDEEIAKSLAAAAAESGSLEIAVEQTADAPQVVPLAGVTRSQMLTPELADAVFALADGALSEAIQSPFGWHVFEVQTVSEGGLTPFEDVRDELEGQLKAEAAADALYEVANQVMDERAGGATLDEVAGQFDLRIERPTPVARDGSADLGGDQPDLPFREALLAEAFSLDAGDEGLLLEQSEGGYFAVRIDEIIEPRDRALEDVREQVREAVMAAARSDAVKAVASSIEARLGEGETLDEIATDLGLSVLESDAVKRTDVGSADFPIAAVQALFEMELDAHNLVESPAGQVIAVLTEINSADEADDAILRQQLTAGLSEALRIELSDQLSDALSAEHPVELNRDRLVEFYTAHDMGG